MEGGAKEMCKRKAEREKEWLRVCLREMAGSGGCFEISNFMLICLLIIQLDIPNEFAVRKSVFSMCESVLYMCVCVVCVHVCYVCMCMCAFKCHFAGALQGQHK